MREKPLIPRNPLFRFFSNAFFYCIAVPLLVVFDFVWFGFRKKGTKNIKELKGNGAVIVCNHVHNFDCTFVGLSILPRRAVFTSLAYLFRLPVVGPLIRVMGSVPVPAELSGMRKFLSELSEGAASGRLVCIYPEGMIEPYCDHLRQFREGAFAVAVRADVPVVPLVLTERPQRGIWRFKKRPCFTMEIGTPLYPIADGSVREKTKELAQRTRSIMEEMQKKGGPQKPETSAEAFLPVENVEESIGT